MEKTLVGKIDKIENTRQASNDLNKRNPHWVRILDYLRQFDPHHYEHVAPLDLTQNGISDAIGISRPHASLVLNDLITRGLVESKLLYIKGQGRRRLAYFISSIGLGVVV